MQLLLTYDSSDEENLRNFDDILDVTQIYHFANNGQIFAGTLVEILSQFNKLDSFEITSLLLSQPRNLSDYQITLISQISSLNQIKKVILQYLNNIEEVYFLIELCPHMIYLLVYDIRNMDIELFLRSMIKYPHQLRLLGFGLSAADDQMIIKLEKIIVRLCY
jgi:hypothetical protein